jgi:peptidoglycan LD-endopeptidase CwlK
MASRAIDDLLPTVAGMAHAMLAACDAAGLPVVVACTYRSNIEQNALYAQGRTLPGRIVTHARGGQSLHNLRRALDVYPLDAGKLAGTDSAAGRALWARLGAIGKGAGFEWGGDWAMRDYPHFQFKGEKI